MGSETIRNAAWQRTRIQLLRYWRPLRRQLLILLLVSGCVSLLPLLLIYLQQPVFKSSSLLEVWLTGNADKPDHSATGVILSREVLTAAMARVGRQTIATLDELKSDLQIIPSAQNRLLTIIFHAHTAESAQDTVRAVTQAYIEHNRAVQLKQAEDAAVLLQQQLELILHAEPWLRDGDNKERGGQGNIQDLSRYEPSASSYLHRGQSPLTLVQLDSDQQAARSILEEAGIRAAIAAYEANIRDNTTIRVIDEALLPLAPESRQLIQPVLTAYLLTFFLGAFVILVRQWQTSKINQGDEAHVLLGYRLLGELPDNRLQDAMAGAARTPDPKEGIGGEAIRNIRTNLCIRLSAAGISRQTPELQDWQQPAARVIVVSSAGQGEGKTTVATQLALALGQLAKVLLIDTVMRQGHVAAPVFANLPARAAGLSHIIAGAAQLQDCLHPLEGTGLDLMPAGVLPPNPQELLANRRFERVLFALSKRYDYIILDAAALDQVADALLLVKHCDHVIFTLRAGDTDVKRASSALQRLAEAAEPGDTEISLIMNRFGSRRPVLSHTQGIARLADTDMNDSKKPGRRYFATDMQ